jgi:hypothetical protein
MAFEDNASPVPRIHILRTPRHLLTSRMGSGEEKRKRNPFDLQKQKQCLLEWMPRRGSGAGGGVVATRPQVATAKVFRRCGGGTGDQKVASQGCRVLLISEDEGRWFFQIPPTLDATVRKKADYLKTPKSSEKKIYLPTHTIINTSVVKKYSGRFPC